MKLETRHSWVMIYELYDIITCLPGATNFRVRMNIQSKDVSYVVNISTSKTMDIVVGTHMYIVHKHINNKQKQLNRHNFVIK